MLPRLVTVIFVSLLVELATQAQGILTTGLEDRAILKVMYDTHWPKEFEEHRFAIVVKNRGTAVAAASRVAVLVLFNIYG